jgi:hypothetical protein
VDAAGNADAVGMSDNDRSAHTAAKGIVGFVLTVILINVLVRVAPFPDVDLPSVSLPDFPGWVDAAWEWMHWIVRAKNVALIAVVLTVIAVAAFRDSKRPDGSDES